MDLQHVNNAVTQDYKFDQRLMGTLSLMTKTGENRRLQRGSDLNEGN